LRNVVIEKNISKKSIFKLDIITTMWNASLINKFDKYVCCDWFISVYRKSDINQDDKICLMSDLPYSYIINNVHTIY